MSFLVWFFFEQQFKPHVADKLHIISEILLSRPFLKNVKPLEAGSLHISIFTQFPDLRKLADSLDVDPLVNSHRGSHLWLTFYPEVGNNSILWNHRNIMEFFLSLKFVSSATSSAVMGTPSSSNSCWKVRTGEIIERLILNWEDWIIVTVIHTNKGHKMLQIQTRGEDSSITHGTSPVEDTSLGDKIGKCCIEKNLVFSWEPWLLRDRPGHFWTLALPLRLGYNWTLKTKDLRDLCDAPLNFLFWWVPELNQ